MPEASEVQSLENQLKRAREKAVRLEKEPENSPERNY
jgi:hypothetical protein